MGGINIVKGLRAKNGIAERAVLHTLSGSPKLNYGP